VCLVRNNYSQVKSRISYNLEKLCFKPLTLEERHRGLQPQVRNNRDERIQTLLAGDGHKHLKQAVRDFSLFWESAPEFKRAKQKQYSHIASVLWEHLTDDGWSSLDEILHEVTLNRKMAYRILRRWVLLEIVDLVDRSAPTAINLKYAYDIRKKISILPDILYVLDRKEFTQLKESTDNLISKTYVPMKDRVK